MATQTFSCFTDTNFIERTVNPSHPCWGHITTHTYYWSELRNMTNISFTLNLTSGQGRWYLSTDGVNWTFMGNLQSTPSVNKTWTTTVANIPYRYLRFEATNSSYIGYMDMSQGTITYMTTVPPPPACIEGTYKDITCWDDSVIHDEVCLCTDTCGWWKTGNTCPEEPFCTEGECRPGYEIECMDGSMGCYEICQGNQWVNNPNICPLVATSISLSPIFYDYGGPKTTITITPASGPAMTYPGVMGIKVYDPTGALILNTQFDMPSNPYDLWFPSGSASGLYTMQVTYGGNIFYSESSGSVTYLHQCNEGDMTDVKECWDGNYQYNYCHQDQWTLTNPCAPCTVEGEGRYCQTCWNGEEVCSQRCYGGEVVGVNEVCDIKVCDEYTFKDQITCWDESKAGGYYCVGNQWWPTNTSCPDEPICTEGEKRNQNLCSDGSYVGGDECIANQWVPIDTECAGGPLEFPWWLLLLLGGGVVAVAAGGKEKKGKR